MLKAKDSGIIAFEDGTVFRGFAFGAKKTVLGEAVFNTSMTGYQEILTDPSYYGQIVTMTPPQIGNYGVNEDDEESKGPKVSGFIVHDLSPVTSNWRSNMSLDDYLKKHDIPGLTGVDTRTLTKKIRTAGALKACISTEGISDEEAIRRAREWPGIEGADFVKEVTCKEIYEWKKDSTPFTVVGTQLIATEKPTKRFRVVAFDMGAKENIFRKLHHHGFDITVVPADTPASKVKEIDPDGIFISNGPGDPSAVTYAHETIAELLPHYPTFGICMGHQIITHALGAKTFKLKFGHRGGNQHVKNIETGEVAITSQNHGFASTQDEIEKCGAIVTEFNLNDQTVSGLRHQEWPVFSVQYHPEASPGPHDSDPLFERFYQLVANSKKS